MPRASTITRVLVRACLIAALAACGSSARSRGEGAWGGSEPQATSGGEADALGGELTEMTGSEPSGDYAQDSVELEVAMRSRSARRGTSIKTSGSGSGPQSAPPAPASPGEAQLAKAEGGGEGVQISATTASEAGDRQLSLVYDARVHLAVFEAEAALDAAEALARTHHGYLVHRADRTITFRIPAAAFHPALEAAMKLGDVLHREVSVRDVTEEFADLHVRLKNAEAVRSRLQELLARATKVEEALQVERELERVAQEVESLKGRIARLTELIAYSTITLHFQAREVEQVDPQVLLPFPWLRELRLTELLAL